jgi:hypothetical protein
MPAALGHLDRRRQSRTAAANHHDIADGLFGVTGRMVVSSRVRHRASMSSALTGQARVPVNTQDKCHLVRMVIPQAFAELRPVSGVRLCDSTGFTAGSFVASGDKALCKCRQQRHSRNGKWLAEIL